MKIVSKKVYLFNFFLDFKFDIWVINKVFDFSCLVLNVYHYRIRF
jgi:hypothetical protein